MSYSTKILGTKYVVSLFFGEDRHWYLELSIGGNVEEQVRLRGYTHKGLEIAINELISRISLPMNDVEIDKLHHDLLKQAAHIFTDEQESELTIVSPVIETDIKESSREKEEKKNHRYRGGLSGLQKELVEEYKAILTKQPQEVIDTPVVYPKDGDIAQVIRNQQQIRQQLLQLENRLTQLEQLTMKIIGEATMMQTS